MVTQMQCDAAREILSAALDNEAEPGEVARAQRHRTTCPRCTDWETSALGLHRRVRLVAADVVPDLSSAIRRSIQREAKTRRPPVMPAACLILSVLALAELLGAIPHLFAPGAALGVHAGREQAAYEIALASGFLYAAVRPRMAGGIAVLSTVFAMLLIVTTGIDVADRQVQLGLETHHLVAILGTALTWAVARARTDGADTTTTPRWAAT